MKYWELIAADLTLAGWSWGYVAETNHAGDTMFTVDAHQDDGKRYIVRSDELLTAFLELSEQLVLRKTAAELKPGMNVNVTLGTEPTKAARINATGK
jgi:hypothetical protein